MVDILIAGDNFILPSLFRDAILAHATRAGVSDDLRFRELTLPWPQVPFGPVDGVDEASGSVEELIDALDGVDAAVTQLAPFSRSVIEASPALRFIGISRGGPVNCDLDAASAAGVAVSFAPGRNARAAAEYAVGLILAATRHLTAAHTELARGVWRGDYYTYENAGIELSGSTVGLIGYGAIGRLVGRILLAFGSRVLVHDPYAAVDDLYADGVEPASLDDLLAASDIVSLHARLTPETTLLLDEAALRRLRPGAVVVNSARGGLLDYGALTRLLADGHLGAAALDVYDVEPPSPDSELLSLPNVVLSPHLAGASRSTARRGASIVAEELVRHLTGAPLAHRANAEVSVS
ncbi:2-hydroxyacid dehydrogenase [Agromyces sp. G08B096]|uniref:2-hydroxyacid dehydrogenase n=1 Tax=Agromyces sp. G08B096 TaxID=3156399 RepID=A0AAU7W5H2_9MICO